MFFVWFSSNMNVLRYVACSCTHQEQKLTDHVHFSFGTGTAGPAFYSLGVRDSIAVIVVTDLV